MSSNSNEREIARGFGFGRARPRIPGPAIGRSSATLAEALGLRPGMDVLLTGSGSAGLKKELTFTGARIVSIMTNGTSDCVIYYADNSYSLRRISELAGRLARDGILWVLWPKAAGHISEQHVKRAGVSAGLVGVRTASVNSHLSGFKFIQAQDTW